MLRLPMFVVCLLAALSLALGSFYRILKLKRPVAIGRVLNRAVPLIKDVDVTDGHSYLEFSFPLCDVIDNGIVVVGIERPSHWGDEVMRGYDDGRNLMRPIVSLGGNPFDNRSNIALNLIGPGWPEILKYNLDLRIKGDAVYRHSFVGMRRRGWSDSHLLNDYIGALSEPDGFSIREKGASRGSSAKERYDNPNHSKSNLQLVALGLDGWQRENIYLGWWSLAGAALCSFIGGFRLMYRKLDSAAWIACGVIFAVFAVVKF